MDAEDISVEELVERYKKGERRFLELAFEGNLRGATLEGARFERCFIVADFRQANLKNTQFLHSNIKTCDFREADLTNAHFEGASVEGTSYKGAKTEGLVFKNNSFMGFYINASDFEKYFKEE